MTNRIAPIALAMLASALPQTLFAAEDCAHPKGRAALSSLVDRYVVAVNAHDTRSFAELFTESYIQHSGRSANGLAAQVANYQRIFAAWPDVRLRLEDRIFDCDKIVVRSTFTATHTQTVQGFAPTGRTISFNTIDIWRVEDGKMAEHWDLVDTAGLQKQLRGD
jgi:predicted ester cyclase